jgi:cell division protein FtsL
MDINRNNYELYLIDYFDGILDGETKTAVEKFLVDNPDIAQDAQQLSSFKLNPLASSYKHKSKLLKSKQLLVGVEDEFDYLCIASLEKDIDQRDKQTLEAAIEKNPQRAIEFQQFQIAKLKADLSITYKHKGKLKRFTTFGFTRRILYTASSAAAVLLILISLFNYMSSLSEVQQIRELANTVETIPIETKTSANSKKFVPVVETNNSLAEPSVNGNSRVDQTTSKAEIAEVIHEFETIENLTIPNYIKPIVAINIVNKGLPNVSKELLAFQMPIIDNYLQQKNPDAEGSSRTIGLFEIAQMGFSKLASTTGKNLSLQAQKDDDGKFKRIEFETNLFALSVPVNRKK